jgi:glutamate-1-semialdehyde 2,1-aminomutase
MTITNSKSEQLYKEAQQYIPGGVNSPVRAFRQVGGEPVFMQSAKGAYLFDADGKRYIDYINSWGPMILGHRHPEVVEAIFKQIGKGFSYGTPTEMETEVARLIIEMVPSVDMVRMVSSGTEACMSAVRLARAFTGRTKILKFEGHYHGHADCFLKKAGSGLATLGIKQSRGVPAAVTNDTCVTPFNDFNAITSIFKEHGEELAAVVVEPVAGNMGCVPPEEGFLQLLRKLCSQHNSILIFDEVMTGFRLSPAGAQGLYNVQPDLATFGKIIGGGLPVGAFGGRREIMEHIAPLGNVYQAGTLSGNPIAIASGYATLKHLNNNQHIYDELNQKTQTLARELLNSLAGLDISINQVGSMISVHFCNAPVKNFEDAKRGDNPRFKAFFHFLLKNGIYLPPSAFESWFVSIALSEEDIEKTVAVAKSFRVII